MFDCRCAGLDKWLCSTIAAFEYSSREILDSIDFTRFLLHGANVVPSGFQLIKRIRRKPARPAAISKPAKASSPATRKMTVNDFDIIKTIGKGSFGKVLLVRRKVYLD